MDDSIEFFYFALFDDMYANDPSCNWLNNLLLLSNYPPKAKLINYFRQWYSLKLSTC